MYQILEWHIVYGKNNPIIITIVSSIIIYILLRYLIKDYKNTTTELKIFLILVISGGTSNLIDRIFRGYVIDYIDINAIFSYPIFNIADISVVIGVIFIIGHVIIKTIKNRRILESGKI